MRGKLSSCMHCMHGVRNIPAYAGKTTLSENSFHAKREHPRVCGENGVEKLASGGLRGTSPRMRGKLIGNKTIQAAFRNIPAYAGKTPPFSKEKKGNMEHPRVCGENLSAF